MKCRIDKIITLWYLGACQGKTETTTDNSHNIDSEY